MPQTGCEFVFSAIGNVSSPKLKNINTFEYIGVDIDLYAGDELVIDTRQGKKDIILNRNKTSVRVFNQLSEGSTFLQLDVGQNEFVRSAISGVENFSIVCRYAIPHSGV